MSDVYTAMASAESKCDFIGRALAHFSNRVKDAASIFVKPNLVSTEAYPTTTDPVVLDAVLSYLPDCDVAVGDGPAFDSILSRNGSSAIRNHPLKCVCDAHQIDFINLNRGEFKQITTDRGYTLFLSAIPNRYDLKISLPVLKRHSICRMTGAVKNHFGLLALHQRIAMHRKKLDLDRGIAEISLAEKFDIFVVDAVETLANAQELRHGGTKAFLGYMFTGTDPVSLDCAGFDLLKRVDSTLAPLRVQDVAHLQYAASYGVGSMDYVLTEL